MALSSRSYGRCRWEPCRSSTGADVPSAVSITDINLVQVRDAIVAAQEAQTQTESQVIAATTAQSCPTSFAARQEEIVRLQSVAASEEEVNFVRFCPFTFDPVKPIVCAGNLGGAAQAALAGQANLDFSCVGTPLGGGTLERFGEDIQNQLDGAEDQLNRTDEELEEFRDEVVAGIPGIFGRVLDILPGGRFIKFLFFAVIAIVVVIILRLVIGIFR